MVPARIILAQKGLVYGVEEWKGFFEEKRNVSNNLKSLMSLETGWDNWGQVLDKLKAGMS